MAALKYLNLNNEYSNLKTKLTDLRIKEYETIYLKESFEKTQKNITERIGDEKCSEEDKQINIASEQNMKNKNPSNTKKSNENIKKSLNCTDLKLLEETKIQISKTEAEIEKIKAEIAKIELLAKANNAIEYMQIRDSLDSYDDCMIDSINAQTGLTVYIINDSERVIETLTNVTIDEKTQNLLKDYIKSGKVILMKKQNVEKCDEQRRQLSNTHNSLYLDEGNPHGVNYGIVYGGKKSRRKRQNRKTKRRRNKKRQRSIAKQASNK